MPLIKAEQAAVFQLPGVVFHGLAAPSRGSRETAVWRIRLDPGAPGAEHSVDREEIFVALAGRATAILGTERLEVGPGDALVVPAAQAFSLTNPHAEAFEAIALAPVGVRATVPGAATFAPPWTE